VHLQGPLAVVHRGRGKPSKRKHSKVFTDQALKLPQGKYNDFGPTLAAEKLASIDAIKVSNEWLRRLMIKNGLWRAKTKRIVVHQLRNRRPQYGELIQIDGSHHAWFEKRGAKCVALVFVDDATSKLQAVHFCPTEDLRGYFAAMSAYVKSYGCPKEIYTDKHSVFTVNHMRGGENKGQTQFARMLQNLNIKQHLANSPQAKGRVERMNRVLQDRLVKEFRMANISDIDADNAFMPRFIEQFNRKFAKPAVEDTDGHIALSEEQVEALEYIFSIQEKRQVSKALTVQYNNAIYVISQIRAIRTLRKRGVTVYEKLNGNIKIFSDKQELVADLLEYVDNYHKPLSRKELDIELDQHIHMSQQVPNCTESKNQLPSC
ncbi:Integrase core domain, partial [endosymbiont of Ridgeia piscesae]